MLLNWPAANSASLRSPAKKPLAPQKQGPAHKPSPALIPGETLRMRAPLSQDTVKFSETTPTAASPRVNTVSPSRPVRFSGLITNWYRSNMTLDQVERKLRAGKSVDDANIFGHTILIQAASEGRHDVVKLLLDWGANVKLQDDDGQTALICAAERGYFDVVKLLLDRGADSKQTTYLNTTALEFAKARGHQDVANLIERHRELADARNALQAEDFEKCWSSLNRIYQSKKQQLFPDLLEIAKEQDIKVAAPALAMMAERHSELPGMKGQQLFDVVVPKFLQSEDPLRVTTGLLSLMYHPEWSEGKNKAILTPILEQCLHNDNVDKSIGAIIVMAHQPGLREGKNEKLFTSKLVEFLKSKEPKKIEAALICLLETDCPSGNLDYAAMLRDSFDWPTELREKARQVWDRRKDFDEGKALVPTSSHAASGKSSPVRSFASSSSVTTEEEEERSPSEVVMEHFRRKKPLSEYSGDLSGLLGNQSAVDYLAQHLKENLALDPKGKQPEGRTLKTQARLAAQYQEDTPDNIRAFWDQACRQGIGQTVPQALGLETPKKGLASIAGMEPLKKKLTSQFINPFWWQKNPDRFRRPDGTLPNVKPPKLNGGLLLYGPEGTGKSFIAEKLAEEMDRPHIKLLPSNVLSHWIGKSEQAIRDAFEQAANSKPPAFVIIDEIDSFLSKKDGMAHQSDMKITNELMQQLEDAPKKDVTVIGTTNHIDKLEQAAVRDGRFAVRLEVPPPDRASRLDMWNMFLKDTTADGSLPFTDEERSELARNTRGYSTARIKNLVGQAANQSLEELKDLDLDILKQLIRETGPSYDEQRMQRYSDVD